MVSLLAFFWQPEKQIPQTKADTIWGLLLVLVVPTKEEGFDMGKAHDRSILCLGQRSTKTTQRQAICFLYLWMHAQRHIPSLVLLLPEAMQVANQQLRGRSASLMAHPVVALQSIQGVG